eukprot:gnl/MRDRNA2_/MRDRNA2_95478_c0_seq1.p1 gnl/MRDRNA2_/MRDRNA2_95478_c0~~gnl/MRDRNA2_/MRDRNA2_95478_c0_seq1.p1  ORF type:complete len:285 (-),score=46.65 gnl/MRDRNA2_/MRDRNA2_95478_c0_seq1:294-1148(-)
MPMPASCVIVANMPCDPRQSIDFSSSTGPAPAMPTIDKPLLALPNLVQLLVCEALSAKTSAAVLNRLLDRPGVKVFSEASIDALRNQLGAECLSDLCMLDRQHIAPLRDLASDEKECLTELCEQLRCELRMSNCSFPLCHPATTSSTLSDRSSHLQQTASVSSQTPHSKPTPSSASALGTPQVEQVGAAVSKEQKQPSHGVTEWPEHEAKHFSGECQPCAYYFKPDSCKWGARCNFCHLCPDGEIKLRKKEKIRALRDQAMREKNSQQASQVVSLSLSSALNCV